MFPEYRDRISQLKTDDARFAKLFHRHNELDQKIQHMEAGITPAAQLVIDGLKREKLQLKDQIYAILRAAESPAA